MPLPRSPSLLFARRSLAENETVTMAIQSRVAFCFCKIDRRILLPKSIRAHKGIDCLLGSGSAGIRLPAVFYSMIVRDNVTTMKTA